MACTPNSKILYLRHFKRKGLKADLVAQPVEHNTFNVGVLGSSPSGITELEKLCNRKAFLLVADLVPTGGK